MRRVELKALRNKLGEYVRLAQGGETILVTDRGRVVAELVPPRQGRAPAASNLVIAELVRKGWITPAPRPLKGPPPRAPMMTFEQLMRELDDDRATGDRVLRIPMRPR